MQLSTDLRWRLSCSTFAREALPDDQFNPDPWQADVLDTSADTLINCSRQSGKSTTTSIRALWTAIYRPKALVLVIAQNFALSKELLKKTKSWLEWTPNAPALTRESTKELEFANGSRIVSLPGQNPDGVRGYSAPALILVDEAAFCDDAVFTALFPMTATNGGQIVLMSTPNGRTGTFAELWLEENDWAKVAVKADQIPRISAAYLAEQRASLPPAKFAQEFECAFNQSGKAIFTADHIEQMKSKKRAGLDNSGAKPEGLKIT